MMFNNRIKKRTLEGIIEGRMSHGKTKNTTEGEVRRNGAILLKTENHLVMAKHVKCLQETEQEKEELEEKEEEKRKN